GVGGSGGWGSRGRGAQAGADVFAGARVNSTVCPGVSTNPPLPPLGPPLARMVPAKVVCVSDHRITLPPLPLPVDDALMVVPASTLTVDAVGMTKVSSLAL